MMLGVGHVCSLILLLAGVGGALAENGLIVEGFVDTTACLSSLNDADVDNNGNVDAEEYVGFVQTQDYTGRLIEIGDYEELPLVLQATFVTLACLCRDARFGGNPNDTTCCLGNNAQISAQTPTNTGERTMVFATCFLTDQAISQVLSSDSPSAAPTGLGTNPPTPLPTLLPTLPPTLPVTLSPTREPTDAPTMTPTAAPTTPSPTPLPGFPTAMPTTATPTQSPTTPAPTDAPTNQPTLPPVPVPTFSPTDPPTVGTTPPTPTFPPIPSLPPAISLRASTLVGYDIATSSTNVFGGDYVNDLISAMDRLAPEVALEVFGTRRVRRQLQQSVTVQLPTGITNLQPIECPETVINDDGAIRCETVVAEIILVQISPADPKVGQYQARLLEAIQDGRLMDMVDSVNADSTVFIVSGLGDDRDINGDNRMSSGAKAGIAIAAFAAAILPIGLYFAMRSRHEEKPNYDVYEPEETPTDLMAKPDMTPVAGSGASPDIRIPHGGGNDPGSGSGPPMTMGQGSKVASSGMIIGPAMGSGTLGAQKPNYGKQQEPIHEPEDNIEEAMDIAPDSSSNAGSSGWSSSAGLSSLNTGSADDSFDAAAAAGASLAVIGAASGITRRMDRTDDAAADRPVHSVPNVSRADLDSAIEAGDWAAVGATAALLAAASDSQSDGGTSGGKSGGTSVSSIDAARAAELDHLVDAGDWEGVVLAAAKFEAAETPPTGEGSVRSGTASSARTGSSGNNGSSTGSGTYEPSVSTSMSESASRAQKRAEIRGEVEALVRRVVPEEIDNVDEMMSQFKGREEELVETLRTMQERLVAQKARAAGHKAAKQEARRSVQRGVVPGTQQLPAGAHDSSSGSSGPATSSSDRAALVGSGPTTMSGASQSSPSTGPLSGQMSSSASGMEQTSQSASESEISARQMRTALELAIEAGDWEAVGEAAALMSDNSYTSASESQSRSAAGAGPFSSSSSTTSRSVRVAGVNADRARELDDMIDKGDWSGVVAAAGRFSRADKVPDKSSTSADSTSRDKSTSQSRDSDSRTRRLKEEADALAQAEIWMAIAEHSKSEGATDVGASDAADWAIARSLSRLRQAERTGESSASNAQQIQSEPHDAQEDESV